MQRWEDNASHSDAQMKMKTENIKKKTLIFPIFWFIFSLAVSAHADPTTEPLLQQGDFTYIGAFKLPPGTFGTTKDTFDYGGGFGSGIVYNDAVNGKSLFLTGYFDTGYVSAQTSIAQVKIPAIIKDPQVVGLSGLTTATAVQGFADPSNGLGSQVLGGQAGIVSVVVYGGKLIGTGSVSYDGSCSQSKSAWVSSLNFSQSAQATGPYTFQGPVGPRWMGGGYMSVIPSEWQSLLGGKVISGNGPQSIISCCASGPGLFVIDADALISQPSASTAIKATPLVYYSCLPGFATCTSTLGAWDSNSPTQMVNGTQVPHVTVTDPYGHGTFTIPYEDTAMNVNGVLFPDGTRSVLFFGRKGLGPFCYGCGCAAGSIGNPSCAPDSACSEHCYDPDYVNNKGNHSYPYTEFVWSYDAKDLAAVKSGAKNPQSVVPVTGWPLGLFNGGGNPTGVAWDPETRLAYVINGFGNSQAPLVHVFKVAGNPGTVPPGSACDVNNDNATNVSDVQQCVNQAIGTTACTTGDVNQDSQCNVVDVQRVVNAALGGQCVTQ
jgi:hypothetical protein